MENNLPAGWIETELAEVTHIIMGQSPPSSSYNEDGNGLPFFQGKAEFTDLHPIVKKWCTQSLKIAKPHDVLLSVRAPVGTVNIADIECCIGRGLTAIRFKYKSDNKFIFYLLKNFENQLSAQATGSTFEAVSKKVVEDLSIPLPPLPEQQRIVEKLDTLMARIANCKTRLEKIPTLLKNFRQSVLAAAVSGELTKEWREEKKKLINGRDILVKIKAEQKLHLKKVKTYSSNSNLELPSLPSNWAWGNWSDYLDYSDDPFKRGPFGSALKKEIFVPSGYKVYEQYCPINDDCSFARYFITKEKFNELRKFAVKKGDFLISCSGVTLGRITQVPDKYDEGVINQAILRVRINQKFFNSDFFKLLFRSPYFQKNIFENSTGSAIPNVKGVDELKAIPLPILTLEEQKEIIRKVEGFFHFADSIESRYQKAKAWFDKLPQSILAKAFRGELVPQNENDEPASELLKRIQQAKQTNHKPSSKAKKEKVV